MQAFLPYALFVVMLAQGAALSPGATRAAPRRPVLLILLLRFLILPLVALGAGLAFDLPGPARAGLILVALSPAAVGALPLGGVAGANLPVLSALIGATSWTFLLASPLLTAIGPGIGTGDAVATAALWVGLPLLLGRLLAGRLGGLGRALTLGASVLTGAMLVVALLSGWDAAAPGTAQSALVLAIAAAGLGLWATRALGGGDDEAFAQALAALVVTPPVVIGLAAALSGPGTWTLAAYPAAVHGIVMYLTALALIILRLKTRRSR